jgi:prevent-host-death family protein
MPRTVNVHEAKTHLSKLLRRVANGEEIVIAKAGKPVARLTPYIPRLARRMPGNDAGKVIIAPDFDEPLPEFGRSF